MLENYPPLKSTHDVSYTFKNTNTYLDYPMPIHYAQTLKVTEGVSTNDEFNYFWNAPGVDNLYYENYYCSS